MRRLTARDGGQAPLSNGEFSLLVVLLWRAQPDPLARPAPGLFAKLHNHEGSFNRSVDLQSLRLRRKIEVDPAEPRYIRTERGAGYRSGVPVDKI